MSFATIYKGYPYGKPKTAELYPNRISTGVSKDNKCFINLDAFTLRIYPMLKKQRPYKHLKNFLIDRLHEYSELLKIAEQQVVDLQLTYPFIPNDYGFEIMEEFVHDDNPDGVPMNVWKHKDLEGIIMIQNPADEVGSRYYVHGIKGQGKALPVVFENTHIAFAFFSALGFDVTKMGEKEPVKLKFTAEEQKELDEINANKKTPLN